MTEQSKKIIKLEPITFEDTVKKMNKLTKEFCNLEIKDVEDTKGYNAVYDARMVVKKKRIEIDKREKFLIQSANQEVGLYKKDAAKQAVIDAENKRKADAEKDEKKRLRDEELKPDKEKALLFAQTITELGTPTVSDTNIYHIIENAMLSLIGISNDIEERINALD